MEEKLAADAVTTTKIAPSAVDTGRVADDAITTLKIAADAVTNLRIAPLAVDTGKLADNAVNSAKILNGAVTTTKIGANAVNTSELASGAVTYDRIAAQAVSGGKIDDAIKNSGQGVHGLRTISTFLGGSDVQASASDHSHGSGNTHDFDYLPAGHIDRILLARQRVRANIRNLDTLTAGEFRLYVRELAIVAVAALNLEIDAPDLSADERWQKRLAGEVVEDFFEWRRAKALEEAGQEAPLHTHDQPRYF